MYAECIFFNVQFNSINYSEIEVLMCQTLSIFINRYTKLCICTQLNVTLKFVSIKLSFVQNSRKTLISIGNNTY